MAPALSPIALMLQAAVAGPPIDLTADGKLKSQPPACARTDRASDDIVVCGHRDSPYRINAMGPPVPPEQLLPDASFRLKNGGSVALRTEAHGLTGGVSSNRAMVTLKLPF